MVPEADPPADSRGERLADTSRSGAAASASTPLGEAPGTRVGRYKLLQVIGEGGFGVVFMAEQEEPVRRRVALKVIKLGMDTKQVIARFEAERQALAMMDHANIARVLDAGTTVTGRPYFVMELVKGVSITEYCDTNNLTARERLELFLPVCRAVQHAHQKGVIHRDLKPTNILVTLHDGKPVPKVIDFGLAKATEHRLTEKTLFTDYRAFVGTPAYMSPEQAEMSGLDVDTRTDVYSLGVLLYELLTGTPPFRTDDLLKAGYGELQRIIREVEPPKPSTRVSTLGTLLAAIAAHRRVEPTRLGVLLRGDLDWIVMRCLEKDRTRRYDTPTSLAEDVARHLKGEAVLAAPPKLGYRIAKLVRRNRGAVAAAGGICAVLLLGVVGTTWGLLRAREKEAQAVADRGAALLAKGQADTARADAERQRAVANAQAYAAHMVAASGALRLGDVAKARVHLAAAPAELRNWEWRWLDGVTTERSVMTLRGHDASPKSVAFSPDGQRLVSASPDGTARIWDLRTGTELGVLRGHRAAAAPRRGAPSGAHNQEWVMTAAFDAQGQRVVTAGSDASLRVWDAGTAKELLTIKTGQRDTESAVFSPDGAQILVCHEEGPPRVFDIASGGELKVLSLPARPGTFAAYDARGHRIVTTHDQGLVCVWDARTLETVLTIEIGSPVLAASLTEDGTQVVVVARTRAAVFDAVAGKEIRRFKWGDEPLVQGAVAADGQRLVAARATGQCALWDTAQERLLGVFAPRLGTLSGLLTSPNAAVVATEWSEGAIWLFSARDAEPMTTLRPHAARMVCTAFSPDASRLASGLDTGEIKLWPVERLPEVPLLRDFDDADSIETAAFSPDGRLIATTTYSSRVVLWSTLTTRPIATLAGSYDGVDDIAFSPDGARLVMNSESTACVWDTASAAIVSTLRGHTAPILVVRYSPDGTRILTASEDKTARIWDASSGTCSATLTGHGAGVVSAVFSPDGALIATASADDTARLWNGHTGNLRYTLTGHTDDVHGAIFSPDGRSVVTWSKDKTARVWSTADGGLLATLQGHQERLRDSCFSPDGSMLATASDDHAAILWDARTYARRAELRGHRHGVWYVAFSPDSTRLLTSSADDTVAVWDVVTGFQVVVLRGHLDRFLTTHEQHGGRSYATNRSVAATIDWRSGWRGHGGKWTGAFRPLFSPDGCKILAPCENAMAALYSAMPLADQREAIRTHSADATQARPVVEKALVAARAARSEATNDTRIADYQRAADQIRSRRDLPADIRPLALELLLEQAARARASLNEAASAVVDKRLYELMFSAEALASISNDPSLTGDLRDRCIALAKDEADDARTLNLRAWWTVSEPALPADRYARALGAAEAAVAKDPDNGYIVNTLGVAQFRCGRYRDALETLTRSTRLNEARGALHADLAFVAMSLHHLDRQQEARESLARLRTLPLGSPNESTGMQDRAFLAEAEALIEGQQKH